VQCSCIRRRPPMCLQIKLIGVIREATGIMKVIGSENIQQEHNIIIFI